MGIIIMRLLILFLLFCGLISYVGMLIEIVQNLIEVIFYDLNRFMTLVKFLDIPVGF